MQKALLFISIGFLLCFIVVLGANFFYFNSPASVQRGAVSGQADSEFIAETVANSNYLEFSFAPKADGVKDYFVTYDLREDTNTIDKADNQLKTAVSKTNPIIFGIERKAGSKYSLEMKISDEINPEVYLHDDKIVIQPAEKK